MDRLFNCSMKILRMQMAWTADDLTAGILQLLRSNSYQEDVHIRPAVYYGVGEHMSIDPEQIEIGCVITAVDRPAKPSLWSGITACVSSWRRIDDDVIPPRAKVTGNYVNSRHVWVEAKLNGYEAGIILNRAGKVSEGPGGCLMMVRNGKVVTPPITAGILESITRLTLIELFRQEMGIDVVEREIDRTELYLADEAFFCGTGAEVQPIVAIDQIPVGTGQTGTIVKEMQNIYFEIVRGQNAKYRHWLTPVFE
jgi:branched-chain amino acid aminotransferase